MTQLANTPENKLKNTYQTALGVDKVNIISLRTYKAAKIMVTIKLDNIITKSRILHNHSKIQYNGSWDLKLIFLRQYLQITVHVHLLNVTAS